MVVRRVEIILGPFEKKVYPQKVIKSTFWDPTEIMIFSRLAIFEAKVPHKQGSECFLRT